MTQYKTEKRKARVGERILITNAVLGEDRYHNGEVYDIKHTIPVEVFTYNNTLINDKEYEVIVGQHPQLPNLDEMNYDELVALSEAVMKALRTRSYKNGYDRGRFGVEIGVPKSDQQKRDEIVAQAKEYVSRFIRSNPNGFEFVVNTKKRTVVALRKSIGNGRVILKGIAKCAPADCFNAHIGKAIALRRAIGLEVPAVYLDVPQPTDVRVGDVVRGRTAYSMQTYEDAVRKIAGGKYEYASGGYDYVDKVNLVVIDDTRAGEGE